MNHFTEVLIEMNEFRKGLIELNKKLDILIEYKTGVTSSGIIIPNKSDKNLKKLYNRFKSNKIDSLIINNNNNNHYNHYKYE
jgi:hypothetical protein